MTILSLGTKLNLSGNITSDDTLVIALSCSPKLDYYFNQQQQCRRTMNCRVRGEKWLWTWSQESWPQGPAYPLANNLPLLPPPPFLCSHLPRITDRVTNPPRLHGRQGSLLPPAWHAGSWGSPFLRIFLCSAHFKCIL